MTESNLNLGDIPTIGNSQISKNIIKDQKNLVKPDVAMFDNAPNDVTFGSFIGKIVIGGVVGICVAALFFATFALGGIGNTDGETVNPMLWILLPVMGFVASFVGNLALAGLYNIFFSKKYYNLSKMFGLIFVSSLLTLPLFVIISALYWFLFNEKIDLIYFILKLQIVFSLYISLNLIDFLSQPNYSASSLMGNTVGCTLATIASLIITGDTVLVTVSAITTYVFTILGAGIWDAIYYKFYERGNNPFYLPSLNELREERQKEEIKKAEEDEDVNVDMK